MIIRTSDQLSSVGELNGIRFERALAEHLKDHFPELAKGRNLSDSHWQRFIKKSVALASTFGFSSETTIWRFSELLGEYGPDLAVFQAVWQELMANHRDRYFGSYVNEALALHDIAHS